MFTFSYFYAGVKLILFINKYHKHHKCIYNKYTNSCFVILSYYNIYFKINTKTLYFFCILVCLSIFVNNMVYKVPLLVHLLLSDLHTLFYFLFFHANTRVPFFDFVSEQFALTDRHLKLSLVI